jgi:tetratricopeptide (TPR) repeat protein
MRFYMASVVVAVFCFAGSACTAMPIDARRTLISQSELQKEIDQTALSSPKQLELVSRSRYSHLADFAYKQYKSVRDEHPNDFWANLLAGVAAENDWEYQTMSSTTETAPSAQMQVVLDKARLFLSRALELKPNFAQANMEYGYFLWQYGNDAQSASRGFSLIQKGVQLSPNNSMAHTLLGEVSSNPYGYYASYYNAARAATEYQRAINLDPLYARPRWGLVVLDLLLKRYADAQIQMTEFLRLTPADVANEKTVKILQNAIQKGLGKG